MSPKTLKHDDFEEPPDPADESNPFVEAQEELVAAREIVSVIEKEHRRISQDLHDNVGQELFGLRLMASTLTDQLRAKGLPEAEVAQLLVDSASEAQRMLRQAIKGVYPKEVDADGLPRALAKFAGEVRDIYHVDCICKTPAQLHLPDHDCAEALLKIANQACRNAAQYAQPQQIVIRLTEEPTGVRMEIENDGQPIDLDDTQSATGIGLALMRTRARSIGAEFLIEPMQGGGTRVDVFLKTRRRNT